MGYRREFQRKQFKLPPIHPIWRGIGCLLAIIIPFMSFALGHLVIEENIENISIPSELRASLDTVIFGEVDFFLAKVLLAVVISFTLFVIILTVYSLAYRVMGASRLGPMDVDPKQHRQINRRAQVQRELEKKRRRKR
jgi:hypothetical protein